MGEVAEFAVALEMETSLYNIVLKHTVLMKKWCDSSMINCPFIHAYQPGKIAGETFEPHRVTFEKGIALGLKVNDDFSTSR